MHLWLNDIAMPPRSRLRCFVAIAFEREDTDATFMVIKSILRTMKITVIRIDRVEHNDDIDDRIISEIQNADFAIADLTYARPSVYFEAGFAQRSIPVIYTVRSDHFTPKADDSSGTLRVHFDLQMKNIIAWKHAPDKRFQKSLKSRISRVIAPVLRQKAIEDQATRRVASFRSLSLNEQRERLKKAAACHFKELNYEVVEVVENNTGGLRLTTLAAVFRGAIMCVKREGSTLRFVLIHVVSSITKGLCQQYYYNVLGLPAYDTDIFGWTPTTAKEEFIICSFGTGGITRMLREVPRLKRCADGSLSYTETKSRALSNRSFHRQLSVYVIESMPKLALLSQELKARFS